MPLPGRGPGRAEEEYARSVAEATKDQRDRVQAARRGVEVAEQEGNRLPPEGG